MIKQTQKNEFGLCEPINTLIDELMQKGFKLVEQRIEDYHFHQLYFKLSGSIQTATSSNLVGFKKIENKYICNCHWSTVELIEP